MTKVHNKMAYRHLVSTQILYMNTDERRSFEQMLTHQVLPFDRIFGDLTREEALKAFIKRMEDAGNKPYAFWNWIGLRHTVSVIHKLFNARDYGYLPAYPTETGHDITPLTLHFQASRIRRLLKSLKCDDLETKSLAETLKAHWFENEFSADDINLFQCFEYSLEPDAKFLYPENRKQA